MDIRRAFRKAVMDKLAGDDQLKGLAGDPVQLTYRPTRKVGTFSATRRIAITFYDSGSRPDPTVPMWDRTLQVDVWSTGGLDLADRVAARVALLLTGSQNPNGSEGSPYPLALPDEPGLVAHMQYEFIVDAWEQDGDLDRVTMTFRALVYQYPEGDK